MSPCLGPGFEDHEPAGHGVGEVAGGQGGGGRGPRDRQGRAVQNPQDGQGLAVQQQVRALDPGESAAGVARRDACDLDPGESWDGGRHQQQLPAGHLDHRSCRRRRRVEPVVQRALEGVDGDRTGKGSTERCRVEDHRRCGAGRLRHGSHRACTGPRCRPARHLAVVRPRSRRAQPEMRRRNRSASWSSRVRSGSCQSSPSRARTRSSRCAMVLTWTWSVSAARRGLVPAPK